MQSSRYRRPPPAETKRLVLQDRDREVLGAIFEHRFLTAEHLHSLWFGGVSLKRTQRRLRQLWLHRLVDRVFLPRIVDGLDGEPVGQSAPLYRLARRGAEVVATTWGLQLESVPHTARQNAAGYATLQHHFVVTDLLVALTVACRGEPRAQLTFERESALRRRLARRPSSERRVPVPDGAFTLHAKHGSSLAFLVEVVRAPAKGGNQSLLAKMQRYAAAHHDGTLKMAYGHERLRAVLFVTPSARRAANYLELARSLTQGGRLFWFGVYTPTARPSSFAGTVLDAPWQSVDGPCTLAAAVEAVSTPVDSHSLPNPI